VARTCVFCGGIPVNQEHALPRWLGRMFTNEIVDFSRTIQYPGSDELDVRLWRGRPFSATVGGPCQTCNGGWMSDLESNAAPIIRPLVNGQDSILSAVEQHLVATWAVKTMLMLRLVVSDIDDQELTQDFYRWLYERRTPPPAEQVWLASYEGEGQWPMTFHYYAVQLAPPGHPKPELPNAHVASFAVGHAAFGLTGHGMESGPVAVPQLPRDTILPIWPTYGAEVRYPPARILAGESEMQSLAVPHEWVEPE
jgi:hypothetical protein